MSTKTPNIELTKPSSDENYSVAVWNGNSDTIDTEMALRVKTSDIQNSLTSTATNKPLSAAQGKALNDSKVNISDIQNNLTSTATNKPLSAAQGKALSDTIATKLTFDEVTLTGGTLESSIKTYLEGKPVGGIASRIYWNSQYVANVFGSRFTANFLEVIVSVYNASTYKYDYRNGTWTVQKFAIPAVSTSSTNFTSATTLTYTGVSVVIPADTNFMLTANLEYMNNMPQEIVISAQTDPSRTYSFMAHNSLGGGTTLCGHTTAQTTYYIIAKYNGSSTNRVYTTLVTF